MALRIGLAACAVLAAGCGRGQDAAVRAVDVAGCQPVRFGAVVGVSLGADAPVLGGGGHYRCMVFPGSATQRVELTVFADGFEPRLFVLEPGDTPHRLVTRGRLDAASRVARASVVLPRTRPYAAVVTADTGARGTFLLSVQVQP